MTEDRRGYGLNPHGQPCGEPGCTELALKANPVWPKCQLHIEEYLAGVFASRLPPPRDGCEPSIDTYINVIRAAFWNVLKFGDIDADNRHGIDVLHGAALAAGLSGTDAWSAATYTNKHMVFELARPFNLWVKDRAAKDAQT